MRAAAVVRLARPGNAVLAGVGVIAGGLAYAPRPEWVPLSLAAGSALFGVAAANALNDAFDAAIDRAAHPERPLPKGHVSVRAAFHWCVLWFGIALWLALATNLFVVLFASLLVLLLVAYELELKARGLAGNLVVSLTVAATFLLGALAAPLPLGTYASADLASGWDGPRAAAPLSMAALAFLANLAREIYKDVDDAPHEVGQRRTLAHRWGARGARRFAAVLLLLAVAAALLPYAWSWFPAASLPFLLPALLLFAAGAVQSQARRAASFSKFGMVLAIVGFLTVGWFSQ